MFEKRVIPIGEKMSERHCRLVGYIGQVAVMSRLGDAYERTRLRPSTNIQVARLRHMCGELALGKFLDVEAKLIGNLDDVDVDMCRKIGFMRSISGANNVLDGDAQAALQYHANQADFRLSQDYLEPFNGLVTYFVDQTTANIMRIDAVSNDNIDHETAHILRVNNEIAYHAKYLVPGTTS